MRSKILPSLPLPVKRLLKKVGADIADARKRRRISTLTMCQRAMISRPTLTKIESGDPDVSIGRYATVLFVLGMTDRLGDIADPAHDQLGLDLESESLPKRIYSSKRRRP
jgi:transcriptional regulator with XRE-family HTH domain